METTLHTDDQPVQILLASPEPALEPALKSGLAARGMACQIHQSDPERDLPEDAADRLAEYDLVIACGSTAEQNGWLREKPPPALVLLVAPGEEALAGQALDAGADDYLIQDPADRYLTLLPRVAEAVIRRRSECLARHRAETAMRESEAKYRSMMEAMTDLVYICGPDYRIRYMNPAMIQRLGGDGTGELCYRVLRRRNRPCVECIHGGDQTAPVPTVNSCALRDGRNYHVSASPIPHPDGSVSRMMIFRDITDQKEIEQALKSAKEAAEAADRSKSEFLANISHEIRTPINVVIGMLDLAMNTQLSPGQQEYLSSAKAAADSLLELLSDVLDFSRLDAGHFSLEPRDFYLKDFMETTLRPFFLRAEQKGLILEWAIDSAVPELLRTDPVGLGQILSNLLHNAVKFTESGRIRVDCQAPDPDYLRFCVSDTGPGIPPEQVETIFDKFTQGDSSSTRAHGGTGLGTTIAKQTAELMGGRIWVESQPGQGSVFHFTVKIEPPQGEPERAFSAFSQQISPSRTPLRILLAEDNPLNVKLVTALLELRGHAVMVAADGKAALACFVQQNFDLILMDVQMPVMDGLEAAQRIRQHEAKHQKAPTPIVALTAHALKWDRERCLAAGMNDYLTKPIRKERFFQVIEKAAAPSQMASDQEPPPADKDPQVFNAETVLDIVGGDPALVRQLVQIFLDNLPDILEKIKASIEQADMDSLRFSAHSLKGMSLNLAAKQVADAALALEKIGKNGQNESAAPAFARLTGEIDRLKSALDAFVREGKDGISDLG